MDWKATLGIFAVWNGLLRDPLGRHQDLQGICQPGILRLKLKELILKNCMVELPRNQVAELHFDKFPDPPTLQCWKTNFKTEVCSCSGCPTDGMLWIKEAEVAKSVGTDSRTLKCSMRRSRLL